MIPTANQKGQQLAKGIVQVEESLNSNIAEMLKQMSVIDGCDSVSQKYCHDAAAIHDVSFLPSRLRVLI